MKSETGQLGDDYAVVFEAAERVVGARGEPAAAGANRTFTEGGLDVTRTLDEEYEVRMDGLLVFRCRGGGRPEVFEPGEWMVRLMHAANQPPAAGDAGEGRDGPRRR